MLYDCLIKTKHFAKIKYQSIECDVCPMMYCNKIY